jgi:hypothetical protein
MFGVHITMSWLVRRDTLVILQNGMPVRAMLPKLLAVTGGNDDDRPIEDPSAG